MRASMESLQPNSISNLLLWRNVSKDSIQFNWDIGQLQRTGKRWKDDEEITLTTNIWTIHGFYVWDGRSSHVIFRSTRTSYTTINGPACSSVRLCQVSSSIPFLPTVLPLITPKRPQITPERSQITQEYPRTASYHPRTSPAHPRTPRSVPKSPQNIPKLPLISCRTSPNHPIAPPG